MLVGVHLNFSMKVILFNYNFGIWINSLYIYKPLNSFRFNWTKLRNIWSVLRIISLSNELVYKNKGTHCDLVKPNSEHFGELPSLRWLESLRCERRQLRSCLR